MSAGLSVTPAASPAAKQTAANASASPRRGREKELSERSMPGTCKIPFDKKSRQRTPANGAGKKLETGCLG
jgi:hypothetical protein